MLLSTWTPLSTTLNATLTTNGTSNGEFYLVCKPSAGWSVLKFFLVNHVAHCFTIRAVPGASAGSYIIAAVAALFFLLWAFSVELTG